MLYHRIAEAIQLETSPVALLISDERPAAAKSLPENRWSCVMSMLHAAAQGETAVFDRRTVGCGGGLIGLGFCADYAGPPGGIEYFLSTGREGGPEGEGYRKTPEMARAFIDALPRVEIPKQFVIFTPLTTVNTAVERPEVVIFLVNPDQLTALVVLANYGRSTSDNVIVPAASGCQSIGILPYYEAKQERPRAVIGTLDVSARPFLPPDKLTFAIPWTMFLEMEEHVEGSFLQRKAWQQVRKRLPEPPGR